LKIEPIEELELAIDHLERGRLAHDVLAMFHRRVNQSLGRPGSPLELDAADYGRLMQESIADAFGRDTGNPVRDALREIDRRLLVQWTDDYRRQHEQYDGLWSGDALLKPEFFEVAFGRTGRDDAPPSTERPLELSADGQTVRIAGRIDRIDTGRVAGHSVFNVIDYKTGRGLKFNSETILAGKTLQLPLYAMAAARLLLGDRDATAWQVGYWYLREGGFKAKQALKMHRRDGDRVVPEPEWEEICDRLAPTIASLVRGMRQGEFPVCNTDPLCTGQCPYRTICRINQVRSLEKTWQPPENQP
jgi:hypothetical protein